MRRWPFGQRSRGRYPGGQLDCPWPGSSWGWEAEWARKVSESPVERQVSEDGPAWIRGGRWCVPVGLWAFYSLGVYKQVMVLVRAMTSNSAPSDSLWRV